MPPAGTGTWAKIPGWGRFSARRLAIVRALLAADAAGLTTTGIARLTENTFDGVRTDLKFGLERRVVVDEGPITHAYSLTPTGIEAAKSYIRAHSKKKGPQTVRVSMDPTTADIPAALALLEQLSRMPGVTVS